MSKDSLVIPQEAVIDSGVRKVVFVPLARANFSPGKSSSVWKETIMNFRYLEGLKEDEQIVVSAQFMLDSESRLREAIQKMLEVRATAASTRQQ